VLPCCTVLHRKLQCVAACCMRRVHVCMYVAVRVVTCCSMAVGLVLGTRYECAPNLRPYCSALDICETRDVCDMTHAMCDMTQDVCDKTH